MNSTVSDGEFAAASNWTPVLYPLTVPPVAFVTLESPN